MSVSSNDLAGNVSPFEAVINTGRPKLKPRKLWLNIHLCLALAVGFLFVLLGLTGSINVFQTELDELLNPDLVVEHPKGAYHSLDELFHVVRSVHPNRTGAWWILMPRHKRGMVQATYLKPEEKADALFAGLMVSVNPYTSEVIKSRFFGETLVTWIYDLHWSLLWGETGHNIVGILGVILMVSISTGLYLWWPRGRKFKQAFTIKRGASAARLIFELHKTFGIYSAVILLVLAFSGVCLVYSDYVRPLVNLFSPVSRDPWAAPEGLQSKVISSGAQRISIARAIVAANRVFPNAELKAVMTPDGETGMYRIDKRQAGESNVNYPVTSVWVDQYSGKILAVRDPNKFTAGETFLNVQFPLHTGEALGLPGRILNCLVGFVPLILYITGIVQWLKKRKSRKYFNSIRRPCAQQ